MVLEPSPATLKKYGLSVEEWKIILDSQEGKCFVCEKVPKKGRLVIDHEHVKGWSKMEKDQRKQYVRGLLCWFCNHYYLSRGISIAKSQRVTKYLEIYEARQKLLKEQAKSED